MNVPITAVVSCVFALVCAGARGESWRVEELGVPITAVTHANSAGVLAPGPGGRGTMFYTSYYSTTGAELVGYDFRRKVAFKKRLPSDGGYGVALGKDGCVYIGGVAPGDLYRYDPNTDALTTVDVKQFGVQYIWDVATAQDGTLYCAAGYPQSRLVAFDPSAGRVRDLGEMVPGQHYLRELCVAGTGAVWSGIGSRAHLIVCDPKDAGTRNVLPERYAANSTVYDVEAVGDYVVASVLYDGVLLVYDAATEKVVHEIPKPPDDISWVIASGGEGHTVYLGTFPSEDVYRCDLRDASLKRVTEGIGQIKFVEAGRWIHAIDDQDYVVYDLERGRVAARARLAEGGDGMAIFALTSGPDGNVYGSTYINMHLFRCDGTSGALTDLGKASRWAGQIDSLSLGRDGRVYVGAYVQAVMSVYDPNRPWRPGRDSDSNPREIGRVGGGQYRTKANALGPDGKLYVGSIPSYNSAATGAFTICDPQTGAMDVHLDFVKGGAVHALVADDAFVYGAGGGEFFVYDPAAREKRFRVERPVTALATMQAGKVVASGDGKLFVYDRGRNEILGEAANALGDFSHMVTGPEGAVYAVNTAHAARIAGDGLSVTALTEEGGQFAALDAQGRLYFARGAKLYRCAPE